MKGIVLVVSLLVSLAFAQSSKSIDECILQRELAYEGYDMRFKEKIDQKTAWKRVQSTKKYKNIRAETVVNTVYHLRRFRDLSYEENQAAFAAGVYSACKGHGSRRHYRCDDVFQPVHRHRSRSYRKSRRPGRCR